MTACVNKKSKRVAAVVTASLVGALSIGAPAVALAANANIDMLVADEAQDIAQGKVTAYTDQDKDAMEGTEFVVNGKAQYIVPTQLTTKTGKVIDIKDGNLSVKYVKVDASSKKWITVEGEKVFVSDVNASDIKDAGTYFVCVGKTEVGANIDTDYSHFKFTIVNKSLEGAKVIDGKDVDDVTIEFTGDLQKFGGDLNVLLGDKVLDSVADYSAKVFKKGATSSEAPRYAGEYVVRLTGKGDFEGSVVEVPFTINAIDLSKAEIVLNQVSGKLGAALPTGVASVDGGTSSVVLGNLSLEFVSASNGLQTPDSTKKGAYTYKVSVKSDATDNVKSSIVNAGEVVVSRYEKDATISYDGKIIPSTGLDLSAQDLNTPKVFDLTKVSVKGGNADLKYTVSYTNGKGEAVSAEDTKLPGKYTATITVQDDTCTYGGSATVTFRVKATIIDVKDVYISYKGKVVDSTVADIYSGEDLLKNVSVKAFDVNGNEVPSSEYVVKVVNTESGKTVDEVVNKGNYKISVETKKGSMYKVDGAANFVILTVDPVTIASTGSNADIMLSGQDKLANGSKVYSFTGKEIIPTFEYDLKTGEYAADEDWKALPASSYRLTFKKDGKTVDSMVEAGIYTVILTDSSKDDNYVVDHTFNNVEVHAYVSFGDVKAGEWYAKPVYQAKVLGYVNGLRNADLFAPTKTITRGDVACILFNMAGGDDIYEGSKNELGGFDTGFNDVNPNMYYAKAIQWAESIDVVNGYGDGSFAPDKLVSREEFACMLANFSKAMHDFEAADSSVLDDFDDANEVDSWAKESVAWAVANKIMGNSGEINADDSILRAEVAAMAVNYMPGMFA